MSTDFEQFFDSLSPAQQTAFAAEAGTTVGYITAHLKHGRKMPRSETFEGLARACGSFGAAITREQLAAFFFDRQRDHAAKLAAT